MASQLNVVPAMSILFLLFVSAAEATKGVAANVGAKAKVGIPGTGLSVGVEVGAKAPSGALDVVAKFGAKADGQTDLCKPLLDAWKEACASPTPSTIVIPKGEYALNPITLQGPCKAPIELLVHGTIKAPAHPKAHKEPKWVTICKVENFKMSGGGVFDGQGTQAYKREDCGQNDFCASLPVNIRFDFLTNALIQDITSKDSKQFHINVLGCKNITFERFKVSAPCESPNTDGIHIGRSDGVNVFNSEIKTGDDCISIGDGAKNVDIRGVTCGPGHGISIGSLGKFQNEEPVAGIKVTNCTISNTSNGVRIKTYPGAYPATASDMHFEDIILNNVSCPVLVDQKYCPHNKCNIKEESKVKLSNISFKNIRGTSALPEAVRIICSGTFPCDKVELSNIDITHSGPKGPAVSQCRNVKPKISGKNNPAACATPCPANPTPTV